jgi:hypothetical protein
MCPMNFYTTLILADFECLDKKLENVAKVLGQGVDLKGFDHFD